MWKLLTGQDAEFATLVVTGQVTGGLAAPVEDQDAAGLVWPRHPAGRGMGHVVADEPDDSRIQAGQRRCEEERRPLSVRDAQVLPRVSKAEFRGGPGERRIERIRDGIEIGRLKPRP